MTKRILAEGGLWSPDQLSVRATIDGFPCVALWGTTAERTERVVARYIEDPDGLSSFLADCWPDARPS